MYFLQRETSTSSALKIRYAVFSVCFPFHVGFNFPLIPDISTVKFVMMMRGTLTHLIFTLLIFDPLEDVVDDATSGGVVKKRVSVVDDETAVKQTN